ncbi:hypothetical protein NOR51B_1601 [Luminiphilus syltensis NOR5-1B]|uniref:Uncharacterized protein n=1 Tax=Luminiphilus syltensis NOR5-1B TaxID=565045 RepID=B8KTD2_9GAMM|nr:hypothetical protein [Luminiphilus syltensis]EED35654.1 hypothetical protein NOR51B_1601 [Luminiphilus syltensis NOR5-1B]
MTQPEEKFLNRLSLLTQELYELKKSGVPGSEYELFQSRVKGFVEAGRLLALVDGRQVQTTIDAAHLKVFGETRQQRRAKDGASSVPDNGQDWAEFDSPAYERYRSGA